MAYAGVSAGLRAAGWAARTLGDRGLGAEVDSGPKARLTRSVVNALLGDRLHDGGDPYALTTTVRVTGEDGVRRDVALTTQGLAAAFPHARESLVVLVHGLGENDESWRHRWAERGGTYASYLEQGGAATTVTVRYNTGRHVSETGAEMSDLLERVVAAWPVPVRAVHLVGHSMGGLVIRSAATAGTSSGCSWSALIASVACLGTPHLGAPLEQAVHHSSRGLRVTAESAPFADLLEVRSDGIHDLRHGHPKEPPTRVQDRHGPMDAVPAGPLPPAAAARVHVVAMALPVSVAPVARWVGDLMVPVRSAAEDPCGGPRATRAIVHSVRGTHLSLLNHPDVAPILVSLVTDALARAAS